MHTYIIGATRSGKTNHMLSLVSGAFCFTDKHGEAGDCRRDRVHLLAPADLLGNNNARGYGSPPSRGRQNYAARIVVMNRSSS
jgi:hypothetical protein